MCGITGIYSFNPEKEIDPAIIHKMTAELIHRGPDDVGYFDLPGISFGFRRLSIIDLNQGNQPHFNEDRSIFSVCNGEIYNYKELRKALEAKGHIFRTQCDVEVLVHLYEEYNTEFPSMLNGQFAFAVYDKKKHLLLAARDPIGIAPLFYAIIDNQWIFASEIKALLKHPSIDRKVNVSALDQVITYPGLISPATMFNGIHSLAAGHSLRIHNGKIVDHEYWDLLYPEEKDISDSLDENSYVQSIEDELIQSVRRRLQADVPVGFYLSGGLDSSLIAALIHTIQPQETRHSFSITFPEKEINERQFQLMMAEKVQSIHHETEFYPEDIIERLRKAIWFTECPIKESYDTCSLALSNLVHETGLKVVLTGEGADELFGGYVGYRLDESRTLLDDDPFNMHTQLEEEVREQLWGDRHFFYERDYYAFRESKTAIYADNVIEQFNNIDSTRTPVINLAKIRNRHPFHKRSYIDFKLRIADHLVADHGDRVAYANSIEARYPFLDHEFIDKIRFIPPEMMIKNSIEKYLLRKAATHYVPSQILQREKFGFVAPGSPYLVKKNIEWINDLLSESTIRRQGYFNPRAVERIKKMYLTEGMTINTTFEQDWLMIILTFGIFLDTFKMPNYS